MQKKIDRSSYKINNFKTHIKKICRELKPKSLLEIGLLDGYSLKAFTDCLPESAKIVGIDIFEKYEFKNAEFEALIHKFKKYHNVSIEYGNFYEYYFKQLNFDLIHIDISNDADVYSFSIENYLPLCNKALLLEGGSVERDNVDWMIKYNKKPINKYLNEINKKFDIEVIQPFPSLTVIKK